ncbi:hypothetical protein R3I93_014565 [Phoxinus phoxinus]|uniref:Uncharacterized protein n=1 Tax=Phoxinus phoxinus TaxID=58324 RepID=A0AAN9H041_9TELE
MTFFHFFVLILGTLILLSLLVFIFIIIFICILYMTKKQGYRQNQSANSGTVEVQAEKTEIVEDEVLYATVNHSGAGETFAPAVKYESGSDYATVVIH